MMGGWWWAARTRRQAAVAESADKGGQSLARKLLLWVLLPQLVLWLAGGVAAYRFAAGYVSEAIDASLLQASRALARQLKPIGTGLLIDFPKAAQDVLEADPADRIYYMVSQPPGHFILGNQSLPQPKFGTGDVPRLGQAYFYDGRMPVMSQDSMRQPLRVVALYLSLGEERDGQTQTLLVQVARSSANREQLVQAILYDMLLPLSSLILLMTLIVWVGIRAGLAPLTRLRQQVEGRVAADLRPLQLAAAPRELWSLASAINSLLGEVHRSVEAQKRFIGDAAHQLRTPLAGLKSQTELALQSASDPELRARLERVHESATRSAHLVTQLLSLARAEPGSAQPADSQPVDLRALAQRLTASLVPRALRARQDLGMEEGAAEPVWVAGNELLLEEAISNLIDNALRYAGYGASITVAVRAEASQALLIVEDDGQGLSGQDLERVFGRFVRASDVGSGCGLGLAIVREIVERHGGQAKLEPVEPHGLRAELRLARTATPTPFQQAAVSLH
jgi:two-component system, OmpR family, sensor histidine kinase TctE